MRIIAIAIVAAGGAFAVAFAAGRQDPPRPAAAVGRPVVLLPAPADRPVVAGLGRAAPLPRLRLPRPPAAGGGALVSEGAAPQNTAPAAGGTVATAAPPASRPQTTTPSSPAGGSPDRAPRNERQPPAIVEDSG